MSKLYNPSVHHNCFGLKRKYPSPFLNKKMLSHSTVFNSYLSYFLDKTTILRNGDNDFLSNVYLIHKDKTYAVDTIHQLPSHLQPEDIFTKKTRTHRNLVKYSPLSHYHLSKVKVL